MLYAFIAHCVKPSILSKIYFFQVSEETTVSGLVSVHSIQVLFAFITFNGFPSLPSPFQTEDPSSQGQAYQHPSKLTPIHVRVERPEKRLQPAREAFCLGVEASLLCYFLETDREYIGVGWRCKIYSSFLPGCTAKLHFPASLAVSMLM